MGVFGGLKLTNKGIALQAKLLSGGALHYNRMAMGDGTLSGSIATMTNLINQKASLPIVKVATLPGGQAVVGVKMDNAAIGTGFYFREIGVFAQDPDEGEILYCYGNAGSSADFIAPGTGGSDVIEKYIDVVTLIGNATSVTATIDTSLVTVTLNDFNAHTALTNGAHGAVSTATANRIIQRDTAGRAKIASPSSADDIARKDTVDAHAGLTNTAHGATAIATPNTLLARDSLGRSKVAAPSAADDIARKDTVDAVDTKIGVLASLSTTNRTSIVLALNELFLNVSNGETSVAAAIAAMGQTALGSMTFAQLAAAIQAISTDANAGTGDVLSGKTFYQGGNKKTGAMPNRGAGTAATGMSQVSGALYIDPQDGYYGSGASINTGISYKTVDQTAVAQIHSGTTIGLQVPAGYYDGNRWVNFSDTEFIPANIKSGVNLFGITGTMPPVSSAAASGSVSTDINTPLVFMTNFNGDAFQRRVIQVTGLGFQPSKVFVWATNGLNGYFVNNPVFSSFVNIGHGYNPSVKFIHYFNNSVIYQGLIDSNWAQPTNGFKLPVNNYDVQYGWVAWA